MYKFSKISLLILYPTISLFTTSFVFGTLLVNLKEGQNEFVGVSVITLISTFASLVVLILASVYAFQAYKTKLFILQPDGTRRAQVSDYFAVAFAVFIFSNLITNIIKLIS